jgi:hypothetical protein
MKGTPALKTHEEIITTRGAGPVDKEALMAQFLVGLKTMHQVEITTDLRSFLSEQGWVRRVLLGCVTEGRCKLCGKCAAEAHMACQEHHKRAELQAGLNYLLGPPPKGNRPLYRGLRMPPNTPLTRSAATCFWGSELEWTVTKAQAILKAQDNKVVCSGHRKSGKGITTPATARELGMVAYKGSGHYQTNVRYQSWYTLPEGLGTGEAENADLQAMMDLGEDNWEQAFPSDDDENTWWPVILLNVDTGLVPDWVCKFDGPVVWVACAVQLLGAPIQAWPVPQANWALV